MFYKKSVFFAVGAPLALAALTRSPVWAQKETKAAPKAPPAKSIPAANLPTAEAVLDKYIEVTGGKAAYEKITSTYTKATMTLAAQGISGTVEAYAKAPNKTYVAQTFEAIGGKAEQGYDGTTGWAKDPLSGLRTLDGSELAQFKAEALFNAPLRWREAYSKTEMLGIKTVEGTPAYAVRLTSKASGKTRTEYYDTKTGLEVKSESITETPQGKFPVETYYSDYRAVDGIKVPYKVRAKISVQELLSTVTDYKNNVPVNDAIFVKPAAAPVTPAEPAAPTAPATPAQPAPAQPAPAAPATP